MSVSFCGERFAVKKGKEYMNKPLNQASVLKEIHHFIGGREIAGSSGRFGDVFNPALGQAAARVPFASESEVAAAVGAAHKALPAWAATPPLRRARVMFKFKELLDQHADALAAIITSEHGKVLYRTDKPRNDRRTDYAALFGWYHPPRAG